jgi:probable lipoprotein NlpC
MRRVVTIIGAVLIMGGCFTVTSIGGQDTEVQSGVRDAGSVTDPAVSDSLQPGLSERQAMIVQAAREVLETQSTVVGGTTYAYDCSGTILTVYAHAGIYLVELFGQYTGNGVARLYGIATDYDVLHARKLPEPGDVIFWDNTYDRNQDGNWNDPLTHAGIVISVAEDGTVEYLHHNYRRGIVTARMNLLKPQTYQDNDGEVLNAPMRMASQRASNPDLWLSSHLFREFASMHRINLGAASIDGQEVVASLQ